MGTSRPLAMVTGASSGMGAEFARQIAGRGYDVVLVARREERLREVAERIGGAEILVADLATDEGLAGAEGRILAAERLELLVNNAGFGRQGRFHEQAAEAGDRMHRLHVLATARLTHAALRVMVPRGRGGIINVSSVAAFMASPGSVSYHATKAWWMAAERVVTESLRGLDRGELFVVPGWRYRAIARLMRTLPRALRHAIMIRYAARQGRDG
jgi:short-subunit dehydrogenase